MGTFMSGTFNLQGACKWGDIFSLYVKIYERIRPHNAITNCAPIPKYISNQNAAVLGSRRLWLQFPKSWRAKRTKHKWAYTGLLSSSAAPRKSLKLPGSM